MAGFVNTSIRFTFVFIGMLATCGDAFAGTPDCAIGELRSLLIRKSGGRPTTASVLGARLGQSDRFALFNRSGMQTLDASALTPGKSYTTIERNGRIIIGEDIGENGVTAGTHVELSRLSSSRYPFDVAEASRTGDFNMTRGGAIRVNADGSVDISGFHNQCIIQAECERAMRTMVEAFESLGVRVRVSTPDRLPPPM